MIDKKRGEAPWKAFRRRWRVLRTIHATRRRIDEKVKAYRAAGFFKAAKP